MNDKTKEPEVIDSTAEVIADTEDESLKEDAQAIAEIEKNTQLVPVPEGLSPLVTAMINKQVTTDQVKDALEIQIMYEKNEADKAFNVAMAEFRKKAPILKKDQHVYFESRSSGKPPTDYWHTSLGYAMAECNPILGDCDLSARWETRQEEGFIFVKCIVTHAMGGSAEDELFAPPDDTGGKNKIQQIVSTTTYLKRATFFSVLGLASEGDDDGRAAGAPPPEPEVLYVSAEQVTELKKMVDENDCLPMDETLEWLKIDDLSKLKAEKFSKAISGMKRKVTKSNKASSK